MARVSGGSASTCEHRILERVGWDRAAILAIVMVDAGSVLFG